MSDPNAKGLVAARAELERRRAAGVFTRRKTPPERLAEHPRSLRLAIAAKCWDCVGGPCADGGYVRAVRECPSTRCPLYEVRGWR